MGYADQGTLPYTLRGQALANNQIGAALGLDASFRSGWSVGGQYRGVYAESRRDHGFFLNVARSW